MIASTCRYQEFKEYIQDTVNELGTFVKYSLLKIMIQLVRSITVRVVECACAAIHLNLRATFVKLFVSHVSSCALLLSKL